MAKAVDYEVLLKQYNGDVIEAEEALPFFSHILTRVRRSAFIEGAFQMCELLEKGQKLRLAYEKNSKIDEWDVSVSVVKNGNTQKIGFLDRNLARYIKVETMQAEVFEPFSLKDGRFSNSGIRIVINKQ